MLVHFWSFMSTSASCALLLILVITDLYTTTRKLTVFCMCCEQLADPPYFSVRPRPIYQRHPGQSVTMPCVAVGDPKPTIVWRKVMPIVIIRPHRSTTYVDAAYCYRPSSVVCPSVCRSLSMSVTLVIPAKTAEPIEMPFGLRSDGPRDGGPDPPM